MEIKQIRLNKMQIFSYLIIDEETKTCALIDPAFETNKILKIVDESGCNLKYVINTHCHADHTAGNAYILEKTNAKLMIHNKDKEKLSSIISMIFSRLLGGKGSPKPDIILNHNDIINIGKSNLKVINTPGHTPGSICLYTDGNIFTGDTLFVGAIGRCDLPGGCYEDLKNSILQIIYKLPEETIVWPGHDYGNRNNSTIINEIQTNQMTMNM